MSEEKSSPTEESPETEPETHPEVTGEVRAEEIPEEDSGREPDEGSTGEPGEGEDAKDAPVRPEGTGEVEVDASPEKEEPGDGGEAESEGDAAEEAPEDTPEATSRDAGSEPPAEVAADTSEEESEASPEAAAEAEEEPSPDAETEASSEAGEVAEGAGADAPKQDEESSEEEGKKKKAEESSEDKKKGKKQKKDEPPEIAALRRAKKERTPVTGRIFGWNKGGFHVVLGETPAFCPRSEMAADGRVDEPDSYVDQEMEFLVLRVQDGGRRIVVSRAAFEKKHEYEERQATLSEISVGATVEGTVTSIVDFGAFVDLGGVEGLVHRSELTRRRYEEISDVVEVGDEVEVKVLKIQKGGRRISLSMKALEPDPWKGVEEKYPEGSVVEATVEHTAQPGAFIELEPGLTGLLPTSKMDIPREAIPARVFPPGREVKVVVMSLDPRRRRISLALEGSKVGATNKDLTEFKQQQRQESGFGSMAAAFADLDVDLEEQEED